MIKGFYGEISLRNIIFYIVFIEYLYILKDKKSFVMKEIFNIILFIFL